MLGDDEGNEGGAQDGRREQSTIAFPYLDQDAAVDVARGVYGRSGLGVCDLDELAAELGQTMSGAFRLKTGTAKLFDLIDREGRSGVKLSELGRQIVLPETEKLGRAESFLRVPLYAAIYDKYKGHLLPPAKALEREMQALGVARKQTDKARQAFERSARQAGFFESGDERLVRPKVEASAESSAASEESSGTAPATGAKSLPSGMEHPLIQGLLLTLPTPGEDWKSDGRVAWLRMAASIFDMIYTGGGGRIAIQDSPMSKAATDQ